MSGSIYGNIFKISTWGESHGKALGVVVDGCPAGVHIDEEIIQQDLDRRRPGAFKYGTKRNESDSVQILSGVFDGITTGTPVSLIVFNKDQKSRDYGNIMNVFRPGHADYTFQSKYGIRDYRGGGRSSGRETLSRTAAGAIARACLKELGIEVYAYTKSIGNVTANTFDRNEIMQNPFCMPDRKAAEEAAVLMEKTAASQDSLGGIIECIADGVPAGVGETVFDKLDACLSKAVMSIGAVKGVEIGAGFSAAGMHGSENNDSFTAINGKAAKLTNNSGGILGGMSDGSQIIIRAAFKPTPSISRPQKTINKNIEEEEIIIKGRHDPVIVPRAVVVTEAMVMITLLDLMLVNMSARIENVKKIYKG